MMKTDFQQLIFGKDNLGNITTILESGGLILYPTDTIWGIGCDANAIMLLPLLVRKPMGVLGSLLAQLCGT